VTQNQYSAAYDGPVYAPSTSPGSPIEGYALEHASLPNEYTIDYEAIVLHYVKPPATADSFDERYSIEFSAGQDAYRCDDGVPVCEQIGTALGSPVMKLSNLEYQVSVQSGVVAVNMVRGSIDPDQVLAVLNDLHVATIDEVAALTTTG
jgi:hypothetical protein